MCIFYKCINAHLHCMLVLQLCTIATMANVYTKMYLLWHRHYQVLTGNKKILCLHTI